MIVVLTLFETLCAFWSLAGELKLCNCCVVTETPRESWTFDVLKELDELLVFSILVELDKPFVFSILDEFDTLFAFWSLSWEVVLCDC